MNRKELQKLANDKNAIVKGEVMNILSEEIKTQRLESAISSNYMQVIQPDYFIHIGIREGEVISSDWGEMMTAESNLSNLERQKKIIKYLEQLITRLNRSLGEPQ